MPTYSPYSCIWISWGTIINSLHDFHLLNLIQVWPLRTIRIVSFNLILQWLNSNFEGVVCSGLVIQVVEGMLEQFFCLPFCVWLYFKIGFFLMNLVLKHRNLLIHLLYTIVRDTSWVSVLLYVVEFLQIRYLVGMFLIYPCCFT
jgi:hypothetical protein